VNPFFDVGWERLVEEQYRRLGTRTPRCLEPGCNESNPFAFTGVDPNVWCYEHQATRTGRGWLEDHHNKGRHNDPADTGAMPANDHRVLNGRQLLWPRETLRNPDGSPLLMAAAALRGWLDVLWLLIVRTVGWIAEFLEQLDAWLRQELGERWWDGFNWRKP
jgi:hypothetical protein